jgi:D-amino peptidase
VATAIATSLERAGIKGPAQEGERMRVHIISDIEGVAGVVKSEQGDGGEPLFEEARRLYTEEINACIRGAFSAGASEVVVMDCHGAGKGWTFNSLLPEALDPRCEWVVQNEWTEYTGFLEEGCDAALFVGMHARAGVADGVLNHTISGSDIYELRFNGTAVGETGINAALCGTFGCPVLLVTGDDAVCGEGTELLGDGLTTVAVKQGLGRQSARNVAPKRAREMIQDGAKRALADLNAVAPYDPGHPCEIEVDLMGSHLVEPYRSRHGVEIVDGRRLVSRADDWWAAWRQFWPMP